MAILQQQAQVVHEHGRVINHKQRIWRTYRAMGLHLPQRLKKTRAHSPQAILGHTRCGQRVLVARFQTYG